MPTVPQHPEWTLRWLEGDMDSNNVWKVNANRDNKTLLFSLCIIHYPCCYHYNYYHNYYHYYYY